MMSKIFRVRWWGIVIMLGKSEGRIMSVTTHIVCTSILDPEERFCNCRFGLGVGAGFIRVSRNQYSKFFITYGTMAAYGITTRMAAELAHSDSSVVFTGSSSSYAAYSGTDDPQ
jgi:hypothetical protein